MNFVVLNHYVVENKAEKLILNSSPKRGKRSSASNPRIPSFCLLLLASFDRSSILDIRITSPSVSVRVFVAGSSATF